MVSLGCEATAQRCAQALLGANTDDHRGWMSHRKFSYLEPAS
jgi:hypothetical protein